MADPPVKAGDLLAGKYRVEKILGAGAMGMVISATQIALDRRVALKFMMGGGVGKEQHEARFLREARVASKLQSQHAAKVLDMGTLESGAPYIVMEFLDGKDLAAVLEQRGPLPVEEAVSYIAQVCEAVAEAHAAGIVHRDIKPANLFLTKGVDGSPCVKLVDFGVAKFAEGGLDLTGAMQTLGSPLYMPPESMNAAKDVDGRADIWSLGVTLYELLAQITPFQAETLVALVTRVCAKEPTPIEQFRPDVPPGLAAVIMACLEKDRDRSWPSVAAFAAALAPYASARPASYAERAARAQGAEVVPLRLTDVLPTEPTRVPPAALLAARAATSTVAGVTSAATSIPRPKLRAVGIVGGVFALGLSAALFVGLRAPAGGTGQAAAPIFAAAASASAALPIVAPAAPVTAAAASASASAAPVSPSASAPTPPAVGPRTKAIPTPRAPAMAPKAAEGPWSGGRQ